MADNTRRPGESRREYARRLGFGEATSSSGSSSGSSSSSEASVQEEATEAFREQGALQDRGGDAPSPTDQTKPADPTEEADGSGGSDSGGFIGNVADAVGGAVNRLTGGGDDGGGSPRRSTDQRVARANRNLAGRREAAAENRARAPSNRDVDDAVGRATARVSQARENLREFRQRQRQETSQPTGEGSGPFDPLGGAEPVRNLRESVDEGATLRLDEVAVPGTAARVPIPEQEVTVSGEGFRSFRQDVQSATGLTYGIGDREQPGGATERSGVDRGNFDADELPGTDDTALARGQNQLQRDFVEGVARTQRRRQRIRQSDLPDRSVFSVAPAAPTGVPLLLSSSAASAGGATAGGTGAAGGSAAGGATGTATASSTALEAGSLLASAGAATGLTGRDGEIPVRDRFAEPELPTSEPGTSAEVDVPSGSRFRQSELEAGETGPQPLEIGLGDVFPGAEIPLGERGTREGRTSDGRAGTTPGEFPLRDDRVTNIVGQRDGTGTFSTSGLLRGRQQREQEEDGRITEEDIPTDLPAPEETRPSIRERRQRDDLLTPERTFPTGESAVVGREVTTEDPVTEQRDRVEQSQEPFARSSAGPRGGRVRLDPVLRVDEDMAAGPRARTRAATTPAVRTRTRVGARTDTDLDLNVGTDTGLDLGLETGQRLTPENVNRTTTQTSTAFETPNPPSFETVTQEVTNDLGISPPGSPGPTRQPRVFEDEDNEQEERLPGFGERDELFSSGFASGEELLEAEIGDDEPPFDEGGLFS